MRAKGSLPCCELMYNTLRIGVKTGYILVTLVLNTLSTNWSIFVILCFVYNDVASSASLPCMRSWLLLLSAAAAAALLAAVSFASHYFIKNT